MAKNPCSTPTLRIRRLVVAALFFGLVLSASLFEGQAQAQSASELTVARRLFRQGISDMEEKKWESARSKFLRSYATVKRASTLLNVAIVESNMNLLVSSTERLRTLLAQAKSSEDAERFKNQARQLLNEIEPRVPSVVVAVKGLLEDDEVQVDGNKIPRSILGVAYPLDPGEHTISIERNGTDIKEESFSLVEGEEKSIEFTAPEKMSLTDPDIVTKQPEPTKNDGDIASQWWFWTLIGVVVVGAVVGVSVIATSQSGKPQYFMGNWGQSIPFD